MTPEIRELEEPFRDTVSYRIGSEVQRHATRLELIEHDRMLANIEIKEIEVIIKEIVDHARRHEIEDYAMQRRLLGIVIMALLSAVGGLVILAVQSALSFVK